MKCGKWCWLGVNGVLQTSRGLDGASSCTRLIKKTSVETEELAGFVKDVSSQSLVSNVHIVVYAESKYSKRLF